MLFAWMVPAAIWLSVPFTAEARSKGNTPARKPPRGTAEICAKGNVTASTASHVQPGTSVTLSCHPQPLPHAGRCRTAVFINGSELVSNYGSSVSTEFRVPTYGRHTFTCKRVCEYKKKLICGIDIKSGNPPDEPRNVLCIQHGMDGHPTCTWDKGRPTYINTTYVIQLSNGTNVLHVSEESLSQESGSLALSKLNFDSTYTLVVAASNELGSASSQPLVFTLIDIVKPHPPDFSVEFENSSATSCTLVWQDEAPARRCRLRHRPLPGHSWSMVESLTGGKHRLDGLEPHTTYEFQLSCRTHPERGLWSDWRTHRTRTPEAAPTGRLDLWYQQQDVDAQRQNISLFWKALGKAEARGRTLRYTVTFHALAPRSPPAEAHLTTQTRYSRVLPRGGYNVTVTAENSRGRSPPASVMTDPGTRDLPPPRNVSATATGNSSILVSWHPPGGPPAPISGYVVGWADTGGTVRPEPQPAWVKLPASARSTAIAEHIQDDVCYHISVFALYGDGAGQAASVRGHSRAKAPSAGPQLYTTPRANGILASWEELPAPQRGGCLTGYRVYLRERDREGVPEPYAILNATAQRSLYLRDLQPGQHYVLWVTASTAAGEGPHGNREIVSVEGAGDWLAVVLTCSFFIFSTCVCSLPPARKLSHSLLSALMPQWQSKAIPDPANAAWAKSYMATKQAELSLPSSPFLHGAGSFEEPETTQVEETFPKPAPPAPQDPLLGGGGEGSWVLGRGPGPDPAYQPLPSTGDPEPYPQQPPGPYKRMAEEVMGQPQSVAEYIANPATGTATAYLPRGTAEDPPEPECHPLTIFPTTFLTPALCCEGNLTLEAVKINRSSVPG